MTVYLQAHARRAPAPGGSVNRPVCLFVLLSRHESKVLPGVTPVPPPPLEGRAGGVTITPPDLPRSSPRLVPVMTEYRRLPRPR